MKDAVWHVNRLDWIEYPSIGQFGGLMFSWDSTIISNQGASATKH